MNGENESVDLEPAQWPGDVLEANPLSPEQDARASAVWHAASTLERRAIGGRTPPEVPDLLRVARYIITGDPGEGL